MSGSYPDLIAMKILRWKYEFKCFKVTMYKTWGTYLLVNSIQTLCAVSLEENMSKNSKTLKEITVSVTLIHHFNSIKMKYDVQEYSTAVMDSFPRPQLSNLQKKDSGNFFLVKILVLWKLPFISNIHMYKIYLK